MFTRKKSSQRLRTCTRCWRGGLPRAWRTCSAMTEWSASAVFCFTSLDCRCCFVDIVELLSRLREISCCSSAAMLGSVVNTRLSPESRMVGEQLQSGFGILSLKVIKSDRANGKPDGARALSVLSPLLYLVNPVRPNRRALYKYGVLHACVVRF